MTILSIAFFAQKESLGDDWGIFRAASLEIFSGRSPFIVEGYFSPPWLPIMFSPLALLPGPLDITVLIVVAVISFMYVLRRLGASWWLVAIFLLTPQLWWGILFGNIDFLVALGLILPPQVGLIFVLTKPQAGAAVAVYWLVESWRIGRARLVLRTFAPLVLLLGISFVLYGFWFTRASTVTAMPWNISNWPHLLPVGVVLLFRSLRSRNIKLAILSAPFISPYVAVHTLPIAVLGLVDDEVEAILGLMALWVVWIFRVNT